MDMKLIMRLAIEVEALRQTIGKDKLTREIMDACLINMGGDPDKCVVDVVNEKMKCKHCHGVGLVLNQLHD